MESIGGEVSCAIMFDDNRWLSSRGFCFSVLFLRNECSDDGYFFRFGDKRASIGRQDLLFFGRRSLVG